MLKKIENFILFSLIIFSVYCALANGISFDAPFDIKMGKERLKYLFSLGSYTDYDFRDARFYPGFYNTFSAFITKMFPPKYELNIWYLNNLAFSFFTIVGISKIAKKLFNKMVGKIVFLLSFLNPIFFGHMAMNSKDTMIAFSFVWSIYLFVRYFENQYFTPKRNHYVFLIGLVIGFGTGVRFAFAATLIPIFILAILEILFFKKFITSKFSIYKLILDFFKVFVIAYLLMVVFWPDTHGNIIIVPFKLFFESIKDPFGLPWILFNGSYYSTHDVPKSYLLVNIFYKTPEYILVCYLIFICFIFLKRDFFDFHFKSSGLKIFSIIFIIFFSNIFLFLVPYRIYDGLRLFLYLIPFLNIIPALIIYYLINHFKKFFSKFLIFIIFSSFIYYLFIFVSLTPYQYTYLNILNGNFSESSKKFENDYWGVSIEELLKKIASNRNLIRVDKPRIAFCGVDMKKTIELLDKLDNFRFKIADYYTEEFDYIIMTNRSQGSRTYDAIEDVKSCFDNFKGDNVISVKRNGLVLSTLRKKID